MKEQSRRESREKVRQKKKKHRKQTLQKQTDNFIEIIDDFTIHFSQVIGQGTYGKVYKVTKKGSEQQFACKFIKQDKINDLQIYYKDKKVAQELEDRLRTQGQFQLSLSKCPYIARMYRTEKNQKGFYFIMQYCETDLAKLLKKEGFLSQQVALKYFKQVMQGIKYIYQKNAFHRDLKPENLLLKNDTIRISDFGFVKIFTQIDKQCKSRRNRFQTQSKVGTFRYMAPDILILLNAQYKQIKTQQKTVNGSESQVSAKQIQDTITKNLEKKYDPQKSDVWSLGIILYKMLYGKQPYDGRSYEQMIKKIKQQKLEFPGSIQFPPGKIVKLKVSKQVIKLVKKMLTEDEGERISFMKLYSKLNLILQQKQKQRLKSGIEINEEDGKKSNQVQQVAKNKKERLLTVYNKIMVRIYKDLANFATLRQIGIQNYSEFSYKIMTLLHQKRTLYLEEQQQSKHKQKQSNKLKNKKSSQQGNQQIDQKVKQEISQYHNVFYQQIKTLSNLKEQESLEKLLLQAYECLKNYQDFQLLIKQVQLYLLFLLQLLCLEMSIIKEDYICATEDKAQSLKIKSILNLKNDVMKLIEQHLKGGDKKKQRSKSVSKEGNKEKQRERSKSSKKDNKQKQKKQKQKQKQKKQKSSKKQTFNDKIK